MIRKRWLFALILLVLVIAGLTFSMWFPTLMDFVGANNETIQGLASLIQIVIWVGAATLIWFGLLHRPSINPDQSLLRPSKDDAFAPQIQEDKSVRVGGDVIGSTVITGDYNKFISPEPEVDETALRMAYLSHVYESCSHLALGGIDRKSASDAEVRLNLQAVYTGLRVQSLKLDQDRLFDELPPREIRILQLKYGLLDGKEYSGKQISQKMGLSPEQYEGIEQGILEKLKRPVLEALNHYPRLVLLGDPGSGKTTFVNYTALCMAGELIGRLPNLEMLTAPLPSDEEDRTIDDNKPQSQPWDHGALLPVRVILRDFAARGLPDDGRMATARDLWDFIAEALNVCSLGDYAAYLRKHLLEVGGMLMLDGLDEVPDANQLRMHIKSAVEDFASVYPKCRILVTSRTYAYQKQDWKLDGFTDTVLASFSKGQIRQFIERWYAHIAVLRNQNEQDALGRAELLKRTIFTNDRLLGLAERPLLLTLMASLHAWRGGALPEKREELYSDTVDLLLDWWESQRVVRNAKGEIALIQPSLAEWLEVDREKVRSLLNKLAFNAHASQPDLIGTADIPEEDLVSGLMHLSKNPDIKPGRLVEFLTNRAGLLLSHGVGVYTFPHRTFQEYLAACYLTDYGYPDQVAELARENPDRWREVALLAGAKATRGGAFALWPLVDAFCRSHTSPEYLISDQWGALLAGKVILENANLEEVSETNKEKVERVRNWQIQLIKTNSLNGLERARAGNTLAYLDDPRFDPQAWHLPAEPLLGFVEISAGPFLMGSQKEDDPDAFDDELDRHTLELPVYYLARYPVTAAQYKAFVTKSGYGTRDEDSLRGISNHPVTLVTWHDALAYCRWLDGKMKAASAEQSAKAHTATQKAFWQGLADGKLQVTLPSEAEWEKAARGVDGRIYPWQGEFDPQKANTAETGLGSTSTVGCFPAGASPYGLQDMSGNVWEWTRSQYKDYPYQPNDGREDLSVEAQRVRRGGSFRYFRRLARCAHRFRGDPDYRFSDIGFRVVVSPSDSGL